VKGRIIINCDCVYCHCGENVPDATRTEKRCSKYVIASIFPLGSYIVYRIATMELYYYHSNLTNAVIAMSNEKSFAGLLFTMLALCFAFFLNYLLDIFSFSKCSISEMYIASMQTKFNTYFRERLITEVGFYKPPWWYNKHLCTVFSFGADICLRYKREIFSHSDGSLFAVDWYPKRPDLNDINGSENHLKICVIVPGLGGNSDTVRWNPDYSHIFSPGDFPLFFGKEMH